MEFTVYLPIARITETVFAIQLRHNMLTVRPTKLHKSRMVPPDSSAVKALMDQATARQRKLSGLNVEAFFVSDQGEPPAKRTVHCTFEKLRAQLGWRACAGHAAPYIHNLCHSFTRHGVLGSYARDPPRQMVISIIGREIQSRGNFNLSDRPPR